MKFSKFILAVAASFLILSQAGAATIVGNLMDIYGGGIDRTIKISPKSTPQAVIYNGTNYTVMDLAKTVSSTNSVFAVVLLGGIYNVDFGTVNGVATPVTKILVPPYDTNTYSFNYVANLATNLGTFVWTNSYGIAAGTNIVITTNGALLVINASAPAAAVPTNFASITVTNDINRGNASDTGKSLNISLGGSAATSPGSGGDGGTVNIASGVNGNGLAGLGGNGGTVTIAQGGTSGLNAVSGGNGGTVNIANASPKGTAGTVNIATNGSTLVGNLTVKSNLNVYENIRNTTGTLSINQNLGNNTGNGINIYADDSIDGQAGSISILAGTASDANGGNVSIYAGNGSSIGGDVLISAGTSPVSGAAANSISILSSSGGYPYIGQINIDGSTIFSSNVYFGSNLYVTNHAYDASGNLLDPEANEYVTASFVRSVLNNGAFLYGTTNTIAVGFSNVVNNATNTVSLQFGGNAPAAYSKGFTNFQNGTYPNGPYFATIISTNTYQAITGPFVNDFYIQANGSSQPAIALCPDIFVTYNLTNLIPICQGAPQSLTMGSTTNLYTWIQAAAQYNSTNTAGFYVVRRVRVTSQNGNNLYINVQGGSATPTTLAFNTPVTVNANYTGTFTGNGSGLTNIPATGIVGTAVTNNASPTFTGLSVGAQTALDVNGNGKFGGVGLTNGVLTGNGSGITNVSASLPSGVASLAIGSLSLTNAIILRTNTSLPTLVTNNTSAISTASIDAASNDGLVILNLATSGNAQNVSTLYFTVTMAQPALSTNPMIVIPLGLSTTNTIAVANGTINRFLPVASSNSFQVFTGGSAPVASTTYQIPFLIFRR